MGTGHQGGGPTHKLDSARVIAALELTAGIKAVAAQNLGVHRSTLHKFIKDNPEIQPAIDEIDEAMKDLVEGKMLTAIKNDDPQMIRFFLERRARDRGYGQKQEVTGKDDGPVQIESVADDYSKLSDDELLEMMRLKQKALSGSKPRPVKPADAP